MAHFHSNSDLSMPFSASNSDLSRSYTFTYCNDNLSISFTEFLSNNGFSNISDLDFLMTFTEK
jgi:hypothetical protein